MKHFITILIIILSFNINLQAVDTGYTICTIYHATQVGMYKNKKCSPFQKCDVTIVIADMGFGEDVVIPQAPSSVYSADSTKMTLYYNVQFLAVTFNDDKSIKIKLGKGKGESGIDEVIQLSMHKNGESYLSISRDPGNDDTMFLLDPIASYQVTHDIDISYKSVAKTKHNTMRRRRRSK